MLQSEITVGSTYIMKVSGTLRRVRVDSIDQRDAVGGKRRSTTIYRCTNLETGKSCYARSASKFRRVVGA